MAAALQETLETPVLVEHQAGMLELVLNRPRALNTLNPEMIRLLQQGLNTARTEGDCRLVLLRGAGERGFCAGGDLKALVQMVREKAWDRASRFFQEEYALDLDLHRFPKPLVALAAGITMGGGLGLAAGADLVVVTEDSRLAMPETGIGFFPDVGATGWLFAKCPPGYPEYLALTGKEVRGAEAVRLGLATHLVPAAKLPALLEALREEAPQLPPAKEEAVPRLEEILTSRGEQKISARPELDAWVARHFAGKTSVQEILDSLAACEDNCRLDGEIRERLQARSPTALALTLKLLRRNENRPLEDVLAAEARAARFLIAHADYLEGIRARLLDRNQQPRWQPASLQELRLALDF
ncbi:MAG: enoyl-CoA hydratase/isomerase family protein [Syntrophales bacterium]|nr:enoyl-CoA hydratase/isomerase family protein [Syntrophales bacterium]MDD5641776.1 enoyl-CoA hydratase/isomerase family protein [Syntrophales bacterium]